MSFVAIGAALTSLLGTAGAGAAGAGAAGAAIPAGMAAAGGMASGVGSAGAAGALPGIASAAGASPLLDAFMTSGAKAAGPMMAQKLLGGGSKAPMSAPMRRPGVSGSMFRPFDPSQLVSSTAGIDHQRLQRLAQILQSQGRLR